MYMVRNNKRINMAGCPAYLALEVTKNQAIIDNKGYDLMTDTGQVVAKVHPTHTEVLAWAKAKFGI
jgi:hypothetical protein